MSLSTEAMVKHFAWDLPAAEARALAATQGRLPFSAFGTKVFKRRRGRRSRRGYIVAKERPGQSRPIEERFFAKRHEGDDDGIGPVTCDAFKAKGCGRGHHRRGGEGTPLNISVASVPLTGTHLEAVPTRFVSVPR